ncbi:hypothetical protein [Parashewanella spongiae]|nr:hypothetical protein [Parashewanella spongiae]
MPNIEPLTRVATVFAHWRINKPSRGTKIPNTLREQAISLLEHYSSSQICTALRISGSQFKQWCQVSNSAESITDFIELPNLPEVIKPNSPVKLELNLSNGDNIHIQGVVDVHFICALIGAMKS